MGTLRLGHEVDDAGQGRVGAQAGGLDDQAAAAGDGAANHTVAGVLVNRYRLAGDHGFVDVGVAVDHDAVCWDLLTGADPAMVADLQVRGWHFLFFSVGVDAVRGGWRQVQQGADGTRGLVACPQFEYLPQQHQGDDHGGGLEVDADPATVITHDGREDPRGQDGDHTVEPRGTHTEADEGEHVEVPAGH